MSLTAEILSIGTELLLGDIINTDAQVISQGLSELGINLFYTSVVGDNPERIKQSVELAKSRADLLITTGGLGPTYDDITKETVSACYGRPLVRHEPTIERLKEYFTKRGIQLTENNYSQAMLPEGCEVLVNEWGTAPGVALEAEGKMVIMLPGPPSECFPMWKECAMAWLRKKSDACLVSRTIRVVGLGEAPMEAMLRPIIEKMTNPTVAPYAKVGECLLRVTAKAKTHDEAYAMTEPVVADMCRRLGDVVYGIDAESLEARVVELLREKGLTLATAESCTGGLVSQRITSVPGASDVYLGGAVTYSNEMKTKILGVPSNMIADHGAVSAEVASAMAKGSRQLTGADIAVALSGVAGPAESENKPMGLVYIAVSTAEGETVRECHFGRAGGRERVRSNASTTALDMVRRAICGLPIVKEN